MLENRFGLTVDGILYDLMNREEFNRVACFITDDVSLYRLRKAALGLRKTRKLRSELIKRLTDWNAELLSFKARKSRC